MLNNLTNFFNLIVGRKVKTTASPNDLVALGVRDPRTPGIYQPAAIKVSDLVPPAGVSSVTGTSPIVSSGGTTPAISIATANASTTGALTFTDFNIFNNKQAALVSGTNIKTINGASILGAGDLSVGKQTHIQTQPVSGRTYYNNVNAAGGGGVGSTVATNKFGCSPFTSSFTFTTSSFSILTSAASSPLISGKLLIYTDTNGAPGSLVHNVALDITTGPGISSVASTFTFTAGVTYWIGWTSFVISGSATLLTLNPAVAVPIGTIGISTIPNFGYSSTTFNFNTPPTGNPAVNLSITDIPFIFITAS